MLNKDTPDVLQTIVSVKIEEVNRLKQEMPVDALQMKMESLEKPVGFSSSLKCEKTSLFICFWEIFFTLTFIII